MKPARVDLYCQRNADFVYQLVQSIDGTATDLTDWSAEMKVKKNFTGESVLDLDSSGSGEISLNHGGVNGVIRILVESSITVDLEPGQYRYDLHVTDPNGVRRSYLQGRFYVEDQVTRP